MRILLATLSLCISSTMAEADQSQISVSSDKRYIVSVVENDNPGIRIVVSDRQTERSMELMDYDDPYPQITGLPRASDFKVIWSQDNRYLAISMNQLTKKRQGVPVLDPILVTTLNVYRIVNDTTFNMKVIDNLTRIDAGKEVVDHWDGAKGFWTIDKKSHKQYHYRRTHRGQIVLNEVQPYKTAIQ